MKWENDNSSQFAPAFLRQIGTSPLSMQQTLLSVPRARQVFGSLNDRLGIFTFTWALDVRGEQARVLQALGLELLGHLLGRLLALDIS